MTRPRYFVWVGAIERYGYPVVLWHGPEGAGQEFARCLKASDAEC